MPNVFFFSVCILFFFYCNQPFTPKPKAYPKIHFPVKKYEWSKINMGKTVLHFKIPDYGKVSIERNRQTPNEIWHNIDFPYFGAKIYLTYKVIHKDLDILIKDCYTMTFKQQIKATMISDSAFTTPYGYSGIWFYVGGDAATKYQFFVSDSKKHFLRGSLYFDTMPNEDSLSIVQDFLRTDIDTFLHTLQFQ